TALGPSTRAPTAETAIPPIGTTALPPTAKLAPAPFSAVVPIRGAGDPQARLVARIRWVAGATAAAGILWGLGMAAFDVALWMVNDKPDFERLYRSDALAEIVYQSLHTLPYLALAWIARELPDTAPLALASVKRWVPKAFACVALGFIADFGA